MVARGGAGLGRVWIEVAELSFGVTGLAVREGPCGRSLVEDAYSNGVESDSLPEPLLGGGFSVFGDVVERRRGGGQLVSFSVEALRHGRDATLVYTFLAKVAGYFFDPEHFTAEVDSAMDAGPKVSLLAFGWRAVPSRRRAKVSWTAWLSI